METKEQLINTIKRWVKIDNEIRALQKEQLARKNEKKKISSLFLLNMSNTISMFFINKVFVYKSWRMAIIPIRQLFDFLSK